MESLYLPGSDAFIRWYQAGHSGPPLICLPGLSLAAAGNFVPLVTHPALSGRRAILIDYLGSGISDAPASFGYSLPEHAETIAAVMDHLGCGPCPVMGYSMGGTVAIELTLQRPDLVSQLIVAEANLLPGGGAASRRIAADTEADFIRTGLPQTLQHLRDAVLAGETDLGFIASSWAQADPRGIYGNARMLVDLPEDFAAKFFALALPRDFFFGEKSLGAEASADSPDPDLLKQHGVGVSVIAGVGHELMRGNPGGFAEALAIALTR